MQKFGLSGNTKGKTRVFPLKQNSEIKPCQSRLKGGKRVKDSAEACAGDLRQSCGLRHLNMLVPGDIQDDTDAFSL